MGKVLVDTGFAEWVFINPHLCTDILCASICQLRRHHFAEPQGAAHGAGPPTSKELSPTMAYERLRVV
jgi:hypothetical protein